MPNNDVSMKLSAETKNFQSQMKLAQASVKTMDQEMKLAQAQYKATGDAETYMSERTRILSNQIKEQESVVEKAEAALAQMEKEGQQASKQYQDMQRAVYEAKTRLEEMRMESAKTADELDDTTKSTDNLSKALANIEKSSKFTAVMSGIQSIGNVMTTVTRKATDLGRKLISLETQSANWADDVTTQAQKYGISVEDLQRMMHAETIADVEVEAMMKARDRLASYGRNNNVLLLTDEQASKQYGIGFKDENGNTRDTMDVFWEFVDYLGKITNENDRDLLAQEFFGRSFRDLNGLYGLGREGYEALMAEAKVTSEAEIQKLQEYNDMLDKLNEQYEVAKRELAIRLLPIAERLTNALDALLKWLIREDNPNADNITTSTDWDSLTEEQKKLVHDHFGFFDLDMMESAAAGGGAFVSGLKSAAGELEAAAYRFGSIAAGTMLSALSGGNSPSTVNNSQYIDRINIRAEADAETIFKGIRDYQKSMQAGYGSN